MSSRTPRRSASTGESSASKNKKSNPSSTPRRRSARLSEEKDPSPPKPNVVVPNVTAKRSIVVRKIAPRKTQLPLAQNKENVERTSSSTRKRSLNSSPNQTRVPDPKPTVLSPIQAPASPQPQPQPQPELDPVWSSKVRRSYSRLSMGDRSFESAKPQSASSPTRRETLFGFEKLKTPEFVRKADTSRGALQTSSLCGGSFNLSEAEDSVDMNIPGVCLVKKNVRRKKVQQIKTSELDVLAAKMNAEFDEAECFELVVE